LVTCSRTSQPERWSPCTTLQLVKVTTSLDAILQSVITAHTVLGGAAMSMAAWTRPRAIGGRQNLGPRLAALELTLNLSVWRPGQGACRAAEKDAEDGQGRGDAFHWRISSMPGSRASPTRARPAVDTSKWT